MVLRIGGNASNEICIKTSVPGQLVSNNENHMMRYVPFISSSHNRKYDLLHAQDISYKLRACLSNT